MTASFVFSGDLACYLPFLLLTPLPPTHSPMLPPDTKATHVQPTQAAESLQEIKGGGREMNIPSKKCTLWRLKRKENETHHFSMNSPLLSSSISFTTYTHFENKYLNLTARDGHFLRAKNNWFRERKMGCYSEQEKGMVCSSFQTQHHLTQILWEKHEG